MHGIWVSEYEPSINPETGKVQSVEGAEPAVGLTLPDVANLVGRYDIENRSYALNTDHYLLLIASAIKKGELTLAQAFTDSRDVGNYATSPDALGAIAKTGGRTILGISNLIGNTCKLLESILYHGKWALAGGHFKSTGDAYEAGDIEDPYLLCPKEFGEIAVPLIGLRGPV